MKAYNLYAVGDLRYVDMEKPYCPEGWAIVKVKCVGICSSDVPRVFTKGTYHFPTVPGHEFSGVVCEVGCPEDSDLIGKHVGVFPLIPCKKCNQCKDKHFEMCHHYDYIGSRRDGAYADYVAVPIWNLVPLADNVSFSSAAMLEPLSVALHAVKMGKIKEKQSVGIVGTGMIGISAGLWARQLNASPVTVIGRSEEKRSLVERCGLDYSTSFDLEYDFVIEAVGTPSSIASAISITSPGGKIVLMGNPSGNIVLQQDIYWRVLRKQLNLFGTWNSSYDGFNPSDWTEATNALAFGKMDVEPLITHRFCKERLLDALCLMRDKKESYCKVMINWE